MTAAAMHYPLISRPQRRRLKRVWRTVRPALVIVGYMAALAAGMLGAALGVIAVGVML